MAIKLSEFDIEYRSCTCIKSQFLAYFVIELPEGTLKKEESISIWKLDVDESSSKNGVGVGIRLISPTEEILEQSF